MQLDSLFAAPRQISASHCEWPAERVASFSRRPATVGERLLILSTCAKCSACQIVSEHDGTRQYWEERHRCDARVLDRHHSELH